MPNSRLPKRLMLSLVHEPRIAGGQEMTHGRSLERHLKYFGLVDDGGKVITFSEWATLAQDRAGWLKRTRTRTNTNPNGTEASAAGRSGNARALLKQSKCRMIQEGEAHWPNSSKNLQKARYLWVLRTPQKQ